LIAPRPGVKPATFRSRVQRSTNATAKTTSYIVVISCYRQTGGRLSSRCMMSSGDGDHGDTSTISQPLYPAQLSTASPCLPADAAAAGGGRNPRCARCSNHGVSVPLKGHKAYCTYRRCECDKCQLVVLRRTIMAQQVAWRRRQDLDRQRKQQQQHQMMMMAKRRKMTPQNENDDPGIIIHRVSKKLCQLIFLLLVCQI